MVASSFASVILMLVGVCVATTFRQQQHRLDSALQRDSAASTGQDVHWAFVTDCSAYQFNQGNLLLASAAAVEQPGVFTWIVYGCDSQAQKDEFKKLDHPRATAYFANSTALTHPKTGKPYQDFQASNRPVSMLDWWKGKRPTEDAIAIIDPDMTWMRAVHLVKNPRSLGNGAYEGPWETQAVSPKHGSGARYGIGCVLQRFGDDVVNKVCDGKEVCKAWHHKSDCEDTYSSGPPWIFHQSDADDILSNWIGTAILVHENWPDMLAEQGSFGITQAQFGVTNTLDAFWFLSAPGGNEQPWNSILAVDYDPCSSRKPPDATMNLPPIWHACSTFHIPYIAQLQGDNTFRLHKDHIHKDLLDCDAPLLAYPPVEALQHYAGKNPLSLLSMAASLFRSAPATEAVFYPTDTVAFRDTWSVCTYTNLVNFYATTYKTKYCDSPNLAASFAYPGYAQGFLNESSRLNRIFRKGGWTDVDYQIGRAG